MRIKISNNEYPISNVQVLLHHSILGACLSGRQVGYLKLICFTFILKLHFNKRQQHLYPGAHYQAFVV